MTQLQLSLLGSPQIAIDGIPAEALSSHKAQALLFYLAVEAAQSHPRRVLASLRVRVLLP